MRNPELTKKLIVEKAMPLFNQKGYRATSLSDITKVTGMTKGAIYGNFENKDAVAEATFESAVEIITEEIRQRIKSAPTAPLKLHAILNYYGEYLHNPPVQGGCPVINTAIEADDNYPLLRTKVVRIMTLIKDSLKKVMYRGIKEGQLKSDVNVEEFATTFYSTILGATLISRVEGDNETYQTVKSKMKKLIEEITI
ncbi:MAG: TetR/AcrR family transcriptional regulator [Cyclobacteriaceae bacterium]